MSRNISPQRGRPLSAQSSGSIGRASGQQKAYLATTTAPPVSGHGHKRVGSVNPTTSQTLLGGDENRMTEVRKRCFITFIFNYFLFILLLKFIAYIMRK